MGGKYESLLYKAIFFCIRRLVDMGAINIMNMDHALAKVNLVIQDAIGVENIIIKHKQPEPEKSETSIKEPLALLRVLSVPYNRLSIRSEGR